MGLSYAALAAIAALGMSDMSSLGSTSQKAVVKKEPKPCEAPNAPKTSVFTFT